MEKKILTELLNLKCSKTGETIELNEVVALHDWGFNTSNNVIAYGSFDWDENQRTFDITYYEPANNILLNSYSEIEDRYDLFRTSPRKLTEEEKEKLNLLK